MLGGIAGYLRVSGCKKVQTVACCEPSMLVGHEKSSFDRRLKRSEDEEMKEGRSLEIKGKVTNADKLCSV